MASSSAGAYSEGQMVAGGFLRTAVSNKDELVKRLKALHTFLASCSQDYPSDKLEVYADLIDKRLTQHADKTVKAFTACCLADVIRIFAPDPPYDDAILRRVFLLFCEQFKGLDNPSGPLFPRYIWMLERLNIVKAAVLMVSLDMADDLMVENVRTLFGVISSGHSNKVEREIVSWLAAAIDEADGLSNTFLGEILQNLVPPAREDNKERYRLARKLLEVTAPRIERPVNEFLTALLADDSEARDEEIPPALQKQVMELLVELGAVGPNFVFAALPLIDDQLRSDEVDVRLRAMEMSVRLVGREQRPGAAAAGPGAVPANFVQRLDDTNAKVREVMCGHARTLLLRIHPGNPLFNEIVAKCEVRTQDGEERVRLAAAAALWDAMRERPSAKLHERESTVAAVSRCLLDRKVTVRREASKRLAEAYVEAIGQDAGAWAPLAAIPARLFAAYCSLANPSQSEDRVFLDGVVEDALLGASAAPEARARRLLALYRSCHASNGEGRSSAGFLAAYLREHARCMKLLRKLAELRAAKKPLESSPGSPVEACIRMLVQGFPAPDDALKQLRAAYSHKDNKVFAALAKASDADTEPGAARSALADALARMGAAKGGEHEPVRAVLRRATATSLSGAVARELAAIAQAAAPAPAAPAPKAGKRRRTSSGAAESPAPAPSEDREEAKGEAAAALALLKAMGEACPRSVAAAAPALVPLVGHAPLAEGALLCLAPAVPELAARDPDALEDLRGRLAPIVEARRGDGRAAKAAVRLAAAAGADEASELLGDAFRELAGALPKLAGPELRAALRVLAAFAFHLPQLFDAEKKKLTSVLVSGIIFGSGGTGAKSPAKAGGNKKERRQQAAAAAGEPSEDARIRAAAAKVLVKFLLGLGKEDAQAAGGAVVKVLQRLMDQRPAEDGDNSGGQAAVDAEFLRQAAALSVARVTAEGHLYRLLTPELSLAACWPMLGETPGLRRRFVAKLERLGREGMSPRFLVALALGAEDSSKPIAAAALAALRSTMADWKRRTANTQAKASAV
eukprot:tig00000076_g2394.t1